MASASDHRAHAALQPADCLILLPQRLPAAVETSIGPAHYPAECTQSDAFLQPSLRARNGRANSNSFFSYGAPKVRIHLPPAVSQHLALGRGMVFFGDVLAVHRFGGADGFAKRAFFFPSPARERSFEEILAGTKTVEY